MTTSSGGSQAASLTAWTPLAKRAVTIWRDADDAGKDYQNQVAEILHEVGASSVATVEVFPMWPEGWDLADPLPKEQSHEALRQLLESALQRRPEACSWAHPDLSLLGTGRRVAPAFPLALLGEFWSSWVGRRAAGRLGAARLCRSRASLLHRGCTGQRALAIGGSRLERAAASLDGSCRLTLVRQVAGHGCRSLPAAAG